MKHLFFLTVSVLLAFSAVRSLMGKEYLTFYDLIKSLSELDLDFDHTFSSYLNMRDSLVSAIQALQTDFSALNILEFLKSQWNAIVFFFKWPLDLLLDSFDHIITIFKFLGTLFA